MHPDLEKLIALQRLDLDLKRARDEVDALPRHLAALAARSAAAQGALLKADESLAVEDKLRRSLESDTGDQNQRIARARRQMDVVTTTTQAGALEHEIAFAASEVKRLEDAELESMERTELRKAQRSSANSDASAAETLLQSERLRASDLIASGQKRISELAADRARLRPTIGEAALSTYDRVAKSKGTGLAEGIDHKCSACQMLVRPQKWNDLRDRGNDETMMTCESCGRLLYWDPARDAPAKPAAHAPHGSTSPDTGLGPAGNARKADLP